MSAAPDPQQARRFAVIAGGGTAGHVHPGLAVADALVQRGHDRASILYVGSQRGIEHDLVPTAGFELKTLPGKGIPRGLSLDAVRAVLALTRGIAEAVALLRKERPSVVLSLGGFAAVPCAVAARLLRIPVVIHEQNAVAGSANRLISRWARVSAVSFPATDLPNARVTGNPVRPEVLAIDRSKDRGAARDRLGVARQNRMIVVTGGSLGALKLNRAAIDAASRLVADGQTTLYHVVGKRDWESLAEDIVQLAAKSGYRAVSYENDMPSVLAAADLVISRAGASTTAELAVVGLPSILIPLPHAPGDHQRANASALVDVGGATMVEDNEFDGDRLVAEVAVIFDEEGRCDAMARAASTVGQRDAADQVAVLMEEFAA